jgi:large subunit ribosomal protein L21
MRRPVARLSPSRARDARVFHAMSYAIIAIGGKQYRVREGERLLVDRLREDEGAEVTPTVLLVGGDGETDLSPEGTVVTARVVGHVLGDKVRIGKYKRRTGYRRHAGFRAKLSQIEIEAIGRKAERPKRAREPKEEKPAGLPDGFETMTVAQIADAAPAWPRPTLEAALSHEREHAARKGAIAAIERALGAEEEQS